MKNIYTIAERDMKSYFSSMVAYVVIMIFLGILGYFFFSFSFIYARISMYMGSDPSLAKGLTPMDSIMRPLYMNMSIVMLLVLPILSMRSLSEEKKLGTVELLFSYPVKNIEIVLGKYFALLGVFKLMIGATLLYPLFLWWCGAEIFVVGLLIAYLGLLLLGGAFLALGLFTSSLSENQTVAAVLGFGSLFMFWIIGWAGDILPQGIAATFLKEISMFDHYRNLVHGIIDTSDLLYYFFFILFRHLL